MTHRAHLYDPTYGHDGAWRNPTYGNANEIDSRYKAIIDNNVEITDEKIAVYNLHTGIGVATTVGLITTIIETNKLKNDPRPWKKKALLISTSSMVRGLEAGTLALLALKTRTAISSLGRNEQLQSTIEYANNILTDVFPGDISTTFDAESLATYAGFSISIAELRIIRSGIAAIAQWRHSDLNTAYNQFGKESMVIIAEESVFFSMAFLINMLYEAGEYAVLPDVTGGWIIGARIFWSVFKKGYQYRENKETMEACKKKRLDGLYETAISSLVYLG